MPLVREQSGAGKYYQLYSATFTSPGTRTYTFNNKYKMAFLKVFGVQVSNFNYGVSAQNCTLELINNMQMSDAAGTSAAYAKGLTYMITDIKPGASVTITISAYHNGFFIFGIK